MVGGDAAPETPVRSESSGGARQARGDQRPLKEAIEAERARLARADSVLGCLLMALELAEESEYKDMPQFADVAAVAQELIRESINKLDSVHIGPLIEHVRS